MSERTLTDAEALDKLAEMYAASTNAEWLYDNPGSSLEHIGDIVAQTGRDVWVEVEDQDDEDEWEDDGDE